MLLNGGMLGFFEIIPLLNDNARFLRLAVNRKRSLPPAARYLPQQFVSLHVHSNLHCYAIDRCSRHCAQRSPEDAIWMTDWCGLERPIPGSGGTREIDSPVWEKRGFLMEKPKVGALRVS